MQPDARAHAGPSKTSQLRLLIAGIYCLLRIVVYWIYNPLRNAVGFTHLLQPATALNAALAA